MSCFRTFPSAVRRRSHLALPLDFYRSSTRNSRTTPLSLFKASTALQVSRHPKNFLNQVMATARVSHKRTYDDFIAPYASFGYSAHAGRNVEAPAPEAMDVMEEVVPMNKRSKYAFHDEEAAQISTPSTQAKLASKAIESFPVLATTEDRTCPNSQSPRNLRSCAFLRLSHPSKALLSRGFKCH